jgi:hypothetical protein
MEGQPLSRDYASLYSVFYYILLQPSNCYVRLNVGNDNHVIN